MAYVPQGRRVWPSLTVDEHLRLASRDRTGAWTVARVYQIFPRLAERKGNGGAELSGGEQQMLAIARALLLNPILLVMDEPTEGLAPVIVEQVAEMLKRLAADGEISVLLIEQNLGVAIDVADTVDVMVNGRIARSMPSAELAADRDLQQRLLGVKVGGDVEAGEASDPEPDSDAADDSVTVYTVRRSTDDVEPATPLEPEPPAERTVRGFHPVERGRPPERAARPAGGAARRSGGGRPVARRGGRGGGRERPRRAGRRASRWPRPSGARPTSPAPSTPRGASSSSCGTAWRSSGVRTVTVDLATSGKPSPAMIHPREVARHHPRGERAVFTGDRGSAVTEMAVAFEQFVLHRRDLGGLISAGGSGGTALATRAMRGLPIGVPKLMVSSVASGDVKPYVGPADICMMYSVTDVAGINRISERVLANAAHALAGMIAHGRRPDGESGVKPAIGLTQFGDTTPCVQAVTKALEERYDCLVFHATGTGGQSMEKLVDSGLLTGVIDVTTTEIADEIVGGVLSAGPGAARRDHPHRAALRGLVRRARHGELLGHGDGARPVPRPDPSRAQPERDAHAHDPRGVRPHRPLHRREAEPDGGPGAVPDPRGRRLPHRRAGPALLGPGRRPGAVRRDRVRIPSDHEPEAPPAAAQLNDPAFADALVTAFDEIVAAPASVPAAGRARAR